MNCKQANKKISLYIDGMLNEKEIASLKKHLKECPECERQLFLFLRMKKALGLLEEKRVPAALKNIRRNKQAREEMSAQQSKKGRVRWVAVASSIAAALIVAFIGFRMLTQQMTLSGSMPEQEKQATEAMEAPQNMEEESMEFAADTDERAEDTASGTEEEAGEDSLNIEIVAQRELAKDYIADFETLAETHDIDYMTGDFDGGVYLHFQMKEALMDDFTNLMEDYSIEIPYEIQDGDFVIIFFE